ncbi:MAG: pilus assembly protein PilM [Candidatus Omnitrophica bacterium]|nr:pilus assembly protein PilM [Candidatus Omnitrophota bacterium]
MQKKNKKILALDVDGEIITLVLAELAKEQIKLVGIKTISLLGLSPADYTQELSARIQEALKEFSPLGREVLVSLHSSSLYLGRYALPGLPQKEISSALRWQFKDAVSEKEEDILFDYLLVKETTDSEGLRQKHYLVCLVPKKEVNALCQLLEKINLEPLKITPPPFSLGKLLPENILPQKIYAVLDFAWTTSTLSFYRNREILFSRLIPVGVKNLVNSLCISLVYKGNNLSLNSQSAWQLLQEVGIPETTEGEWHGFPFSQILILLRPELERLATELIRSLDYFSFTLKEGTPEKIFLTGIGSAIKGLLKILTPSLHFPLEVLTFPVATSLELSPQEKNALTAPLANILNRFHKTIDFLPQEFRIAQIPALKKAINLFSLIVTFFLLGSIILALPRNIIQKKELTRFKKQMPNFEKLRALKQEFDRKREIKDIISAGKMNFNWVIQEISALLPPKAIISRMNIDKNSRSIELLGVIFAGDFVENIVVEMMKNMENSKIFFEPKLESIRKSPEKSLAEFKIKARIR